MRIIQFGDSVHIESINKTGVVIRVYNSSLGLGKICVLVKFPDGTVGNYAEQSVELIMDD